MKDTNYTEVLQSESMYVWVTKLHIQLMAELADMEIPDLYINSNRIIRTFVEAIHFEFNSCAKFVHMDRLYIIVSSSR